MDVVGFYKTLSRTYQTRVELPYNVMKGTEYLLSLYTCVVRTEEKKVVLYSEELTVTTE